MDKAFRWRAVVVRMVSLAMALAVTLALSKPLLALPPADAPARQEEVSTAGGLPTVVFSVQPDHVVVSMCCTHQASHVVASVQGLQAFSFQLSFDPELLALSDLDAEQTGAQLRLGEAVRALPHTVHANRIDVASGTAELRVELLDASTLDGEVTLATIMWLPAQPGEGSVEFLDAAATIDSPEVPWIVTRPGTISISPTCGEVSGVCRLEGRMQHDGVRVVNDRGDVTWTDTSGSFTIAGTPVMTMSHPAYVSARVDLRERLARLAPLSDPARVDLGEIQLRAGDLNEDGLVNVFDLTYLANHFQTSAETSDINMDGFVDVMDMVLVANNFGIQGPIVVQ